MFPHFYKAANFVNLCLNINQNKIKSFLSGIKLYTTSSCYKWFYTILCDRSKNMLCWTRKRDSAAYAYRYMKMNKFDKFILVVGTFGVGGCMALPLRIAVCYFAPNIVWTGGRDFCNRIFHFYVTFFLFSLFAVLVALGYLIIVYRIRKTKKRR